MNVARKTPQDRIGTQPAIGVSVSANLGLPVVSHPVPKLSGILKLSAHSAHSPALRITTASFVTYRGLAGWTISATGCSWAYMPAKDHENRCAWRMGVLGAARSRLAM